MTIIRAYKIVITINGYDLCQFDVDGLNKNHANQLANRLRDAYSESLREHYKTMNWPAPKIKVIVKSLKLLK